MENIPSSLRVRVRKSYLPLFKSIQKMGLFKQHSDLFTLCAALGSTNTNEKDASISTELCQANTLTSYQVTILKSLTFQKNGAMPETMEEVIRLTERFADAGMECLITTVLADEVVDLDGEKAFQPDAADEIQKKLSSHVHQQMTTVPF